MNTMNYNPNGMGMPMNQSGQVMGQPGMPIGQPGMMNFNTVQNMQNMTMQPMQNMQNMQNIPGMQPMQNMSGIPNMGGMPDQMGNMANMNPMGQMNPMGSMTPMAPMNSMMNPMMGEMNVDIPNNGEAFSTMEDANGFRAPWNVWPSTPAGCEMTNSGVPLSILYSPLHHIEADSIISGRYPTICRSCGMVMNSYCKFEVDKNMYKCSGCGSPNYINAVAPQAQTTVKPDFDSIVESRKETVEYIINHVNSNETNCPGTFAFVVDTCMSQEEFSKVCESLQWAIDVLPGNTRVCLITFGTTIQVHELCSDFYPRKLVFRGQKDFTAGDVHRFLGMTEGTEFSAQKFVMPLNECSEMLTEIIEDLKVDPWDVQEKHRPYRASGAALSMAVSILQAVNKNLVFTGAGSNSSTNTASQPQIGPQAALTEKIAALQQLQAQYQQLTVTYQQYSQQYEATRAQYNAAAAQAPQNQAVMMQLMNTIQTITNNVNTIRTRSMSIQQEIVTLQNDIQKLRTEAASVNPQQQTVNNQMAVKNVNKSGRIIFLTSGPCTLGQGQVVNTEITELMRHWPDIQEKNEPAKNVKKAREFYGNLAIRALEANSSVHTFSCNIDQTGLYEMRPLMELTGGHMLISESFSYQAFGRSWRKFFECFAKGEEQQNTSNNGASSSATTDATANNQKEEDAEDEEPANEIFELGSNCSVTVTMSKNTPYKISNAIGHFVSARHFIPQLVTPSNEITGGTNRWIAPSIDSASTITVLFDSNTETQPVQMGSSMFVLQFQTTYVDRCGKTRLRVTTHSFPMQPSVGLIKQGFDQEAAAVVLAKIIANKTNGCIFGYSKTELQKLHQKIMSQVSLNPLSTVCNTELVSPSRYIEIKNLDSIGESCDDAIRSVDKTLIRLTNYFLISNNVYGGPQNASSCKFSSNFEFFPQFMYHYRRSEFLRLFGQSPDETSMKRFQLLRQTCKNSLTMIQPVLWAYTIENPEPKPVFLDSTELLPDRILLFDSFFNVLVWVGSRVAAWREAGLHNRPEYSNVKTLLEAPSFETEDILSERFPAPRFDETDQKGSQDRILLCRVNPTSTHKREVPGMTNEVQGERIATDDVSMQMFLDHLKNVCINNNRQN